MRLLLAGTAAIALSGCSFMGGGHYGAPSAQSYGHYSAPVTRHHSQPRAYSRLNLEGAVGQEFMVGGDFTTPDDVAPVVGLTPGTVSMKDAYSSATRYELGGSYALNPARKFTVMASYSSATGNDVVLGTLAGPPNNQLRGTPSDYNALGVEAGIRQYFAPRPAPFFRSVRPYIEAKLGAAEIDDITIQNLRDNGGAVNGGSATFYEGGWVPTAAGMIGFETPISRSATLALETGIRYRGELEPETTDFGPGGGVGILAGLNNGSENLTVPVSLRGRFRF